MGIDEKLKLFKEAMTSQYAGIVFDIDGTLTVFGEEIIPAFAAETLARISTEVPVAVCTARTLRHALEAITPVFARSSNPDYCKRNWYFFCENGGIGYAFNNDKNDYEEIYRVLYPYTEEQRQGMFSRLKDSVKELCGESKTNEISMVFKPANKYTAPLEEVQKTCHQMAEILKGKLQMIDAKNALRIGDSGTGVDIYPYNGDKLTGVKAFAKILQEKRGINLGEKLTELVLIGDSVQNNGNDTVFLSGEIGTPFCVGEIGPNANYPLPVFDLSDNSILKGPEGTIYLVNNLKFRI